MKTLFVSLLFAASAAFANAQEPSSTFFYVSAPDSVVGRGRTDFLFEREPGQISGYGNPHSCSFFIESNSEPLWFMSFRLESDFFEIGHTYYPIPQFMGGEGPRMVFEDVDTPVTNFADGWFKIIEYSHSPWVDPLDSSRYGYHLDSAAIDFVQFDELDPVKWNFGSFRFNSSIPLTTSIPEPSAYGALAGISIFGFVLCARRKVRPTSSVSAGS